MQIHIKIILISVLYFKVYATYFEVWTNKIHVQYFNCNCTVVCYSVLHLNLIYFKCTKLQLYREKYVITNIFKYMTYKFQ